MENVSTLNITTSAAGSALAHFFGYHTVAIFLISPLTILGNGTTLVCFWKFEYLRVRKNVLIASLSAADLLVGLVTLACQVYLVFVAGKCVSTTEFFAVLSIGSLPPYISMFHLITVGLDRFLAISMPLRYTAIVTDTTLIWIVAASWVIPTVFVAFTFTWLIGKGPVYCFRGFPAIPVFIITVCTIYIIIAIILCSLYGYIFRISRIHSQKIKESTTGNTAGNKMFKSTKMILSILGAYLICYIPYMTLVFVVLLEIENPLLLVISGFVSLETILLNSCINVVMYASIAKDFRQAYQQLLCQCCWKRNRTEPIRDQVDIVDISNYG